LPWPPFQAVGSCCVRAFSGLIEKSLETRAGKQVAALVLVRRRPKWIPKRIRSIVHTNRQAKRLGSRKGYRKSKRIEKFALVREKHVVNRPISGLLHRCCSEKWRLPTLKPKHIVAEDYFLYEKAPKRVTARRLEDGLKLKHVATNTV
jgi:hypothetical protein